MEKKIPAVFITLLVLGCSSNSNSSSTYNFSQTSDESHSDDNPYKEIQEIPLPAGYERTQSGPATFSSYLRNFKLKKNKTVYLYNGQPKQNQSAQFALLDISVGDKDLQQCADAIMRLRAEYLFTQKQYDKIVFFDNDKTTYKFSTPYTRENLTRYLDRVFGMCGSASLSKQLKPVSNFKDIQPGDVIIRGGFPGHAVIVTDVAENALGNKIYMLAQSYMPAQDIHVLINPENADFSPWYKVKEEYIIQTPEYSFTRNELKRW